MAVVYQTRDDLKRAHLTAEKKEAEQSAGALFSASILGGSAGVLGLQLDKARPEPGLLGKLSGWLSMTTAILGGVALVGMFFQRNTASKLNEQLQAMGPQEIILPPDVQPHDPIPPGKAKYGSLVRESQAEDCGKPGHKR